MALPTVADAKAYLRIPTSITAEDGLLTQLLSRATAAVVGYLGRPVVAVTKTYSRVVPVQLHDSAYREAILLPDAPISAAGVAVIDDDGETVAGSEYTIDAPTGILYPESANGVWSVWPYTVTASVGLAHHPEYATVIEAAISAAIIDVVADRYQRRNPGATSQSDGGVSESYGQSGMPSRVEETLKPWRRAPRV